MKKLTLALLVVLAMATTACAEVKDIDLAWDNPASDTDLIDSWYLTSDADNRSIDADRRTFRAHAPTTGCRTWTLISLKDNRYSTGATVEWCQDSDPVHDPSLPVALNFTAVPDEH